MRVCRTVLAVLCILCACPALAASRGPLAIILLPGTSLAQWQRSDAPALQKIMAEGALAVMNTRTARRASDCVRESPESAALTLGAGSRAAGGIEIANFHSAAQPVPGQSCTYGQLYARRIGFAVDPHAWVNPDFARILRENQGKGYDLLPGNLGDALRRQSIQSIAGGGRFAFAVACGSDGTIPRVSAGVMLPHPLPDCLIWDAGSDLVAADNLIASAAAEVQRRHGTLLVLSPFVGDADYAAGRRLAPIVQWGQGTPSGLLYSPSTHRAGLVTNTDFAPAVVALLGAQPGSAWLPSKPFGQRWEPRPASGAVSKVLNFEAAAYRQARGMRVLPLAAILLGFALLIGIALRRRFQTALLAWIPPVIIWSLLVSPDAASAVIAAVIAGGALWFIAARFAAAWAMMIAAGLIAVTLLVDLVTGDTLMRWGLLGYSAIEGARYYGIGNEAMGPLIGAVLVLAAAFWPSSQSGQIGIVLGMAALAALLGLPTAGAKAGGVLVAAAAFAVFTWTIWRRKWSIKAIGAVAALMVLALALIAVGERGLGRTHETHIGRGVERIRSLGAAEAADIITRKLAVEARLLYHSAWALPLWIGVGGLMAISRERLDTRTRALLNGGAASLATCVAVNDAGVVAGALCGIVVISGLCARVSCQSPSPEGDNRLPGSGPALRL